MKALYASLSLLGLLLVGSCAYDPGVPPVSHSEGYTVQATYTNGRTYDIYVSCIKSDKVFITQTGLSVIHNHEDCH